MFAKQFRHARLHTRAAATESPLWLGVDLGTCDVVSMVVDRDGQPVAVCLDWADVVRDGIVWDFFGAVTIVRRHLDTLEQQFGRRFSHAATSFPPGTDPRISINVLESAGLEVSHVLDEPTAVADLLQLDNAGVVDIGGGTTGIAIVKKGKVTYSADEATGGHHISLTLAGNRRISLEEAEQYKRGHGEEIWPAVKPVYEKMADIVARHIEGQGITDLWLAGGRLVTQRCRRLQTWGEPLFVVRHLLLLKQCETHRLIHSDADGQTYARWLPLHRLAW